MKDPIENINAALYRFHIMSSMYSDLENHKSNCAILSKAYAEAKSELAVECDKCIVSDEECHECNRNTNYTNLYQE